jgi:two-component system response regulator AtoC
MKKRILVVEDNPGVREIVRDKLVEKGYDVEEASTREEGQKALEKLNELLDLVILDIRIPDQPGGVDRPENGLGLLNEIKGREPSPDVLIMTAVEMTGVERLDEEIQEALNTVPHIFKTFDAEIWVAQLAERVDEFLQQKDLAEEGQIARDIRVQEAKSRLIHGESQAIREVLDSIKKIANTNATVIITGETGTGKELAARAIHYSSPRASKPFKGVNLAALPETIIERELFGHEKGAFTGAMSRRIGYFEYTQGGTIFLDEVGVLSNAIQVKLLRVLEEREFTRLGGTNTIKFDVRVIAATNQNLEKLVEEGRFREDLYYRFKVFPIFIPPLRERREDIPLLAKLFIENYRKELNKPVSGISPDAMDMLKSYRWPGNVRELENTIERAVILVNEGVIHADHILFPGLAINPPVDSSELPEDVGQAAKQIWDEVISGRSSLGKACSSFEKLAIEKVLKHTDGNVTKAAKDYLKTTRPPLYKKIKKYNIRVK